MSKPRVLVVGGGVIGVCCAYYLSKRNVDVIVLERDAIGKGASYGSAGVIAAGHPPMNKPDRVRQALKSVLDSTTPLYIAPRFDPALAAWLWRFSANCTERKLTANMNVLGPLGHATLQLFAQLIAEEEIACDYQASGYYEVCRTEQGTAHACRDVALMRAHGFDAEVLTGEEIGARMMSLKNGVMGGAYFPDSATCDPYRFVIEMAERVRRAGGRTEAGQVVTKVEGGAHPAVRLATGERFEADAVVLATGAYSLQLARELGCRLPIQPGKGYHRDLKFGEGSRPPLEAACVLGETSVFCTPMSGRLRLAGTMEFSGLNHRMRPSRLAQLTAAAEQYLSGIGPSRVISEWCGLRPCTPDGLPVVGRLPGQTKVFAATGHAMTGLTLGPVTGSLMADLVTGATPSTEVTALAPARF
jgi:D-amino-acid dehydrogenase